MRRTQTGPGFAVEILVKEHEVAPMWIFREAAIVSVARPASLRVAEKDLRESTGELFRRLLQRHVVT